MVGSYFLDTGRTAMALTRAPPTPIPGRGAKGGGAASGQPPTTTATSTPASIGVGSVFFL